MLTNAEDVLYDACLLADCVDNDMNVYISDYVQGDPKNGLLFDSL